MKHILLYLLIASSSFLKSQERNEEINMVGDFNTLNVYAGIEVNLIKSKENKIILSDKNKDFSVFGYKVKNKVLKLRVEIDKKLSLGKIFVDVYYNNEIDAVNLFQGSKLFLKTPLIQTYINIKVQEGSTFEGKVTTDKTNITVASGGSINIEGASAVLDIKATTGGVCSAEHLSSEQTKIKASIGSVVYAKASVLMDAKASTGAIIRVYGSPKKFYYKSTLFGSVKVMKQKSQLKSSSGGYIEEVKQ